MHINLVDTAVRGAAVVAGLLAMVPSIARAGFSVAERQLLLDGVPFQVRGVCYQPAPIGDDPSAAPPYGDYYTADRAALTARDLPNLRALRANVIRVYGWNPAADHRAFLDACYNGGEDPIFVLVNRWIDPGTSWSSAAAVDAIRQEFLALDAGLDDHPAVLGIILGNEANARNNNGANTAFWTAMNSIAASIKAQTPGRLVSMAITDAIPQIAARDAAMSALDFWCVQTYRGTSLGTLFSEYAAASTRPLVLTEFGIDAFNQATGQAYPDNAAFVGSTVAGLWTEIAGNSATCAGACVFAYADEWWKSGNPWAHDAGGFALGSLPDGFANEEWWGLYAVADNGAAPDTLTPRATVAALHSAWAPPRVEIVTAPVSQTIAPGGAVVLSASARVDVDVPLSYQWLKNGVPISGATQAEYVRDALTTGDSGWYAVRVRAGATTVVSEAARLLVAVPDPGHVINISVRSRAGEGAEVLIAGFVIDGNVPRRVLVRGVGPGLIRHGVPGVLEDPILRVFDADGQVIAVNDDWSTSDDAAEIAVVARSVGAFTLAEGSKDAALQRTLVPGLFTAHVGAASGGPGVALIEVYEVP